jgi:hypothetical protein
MFAGLLRTLFYIVMVWFVWRWLDRLVGGGRRTQRPSSDTRRSNPSSREDRPDDSKEGEYVDFEEVKD